MPNGRVSNQIRNPLPNQSIEARTSAGSAHRRSKWRNPEMLPRRSRVIRNRAPKPRRLATTKTVTPTRMAPGGTRNPEPERKDELSGMLDQNREIRFRGHHLTAAPRSKSSNAGYRPTRSGSIIRLIGVPW